MKNYVQPGKTITLTAPYAVASGDGLLVGSIFGIAAGTAAVAEPVETALVGVFDIAKVGSAGLDRRRKGLLGRHQQALHDGRDRQHPHRRGRGSGGRRRG